MNASSPEYSPPGNPLVSVVMPAYNAERYIAEALQSIVAQTYTHWELIVVDDGSTDATKRILAEHARPNIRIITNPENRGLPRSLNTGVRAAHGRYIARLDADDLMVPERLARQAAFLERNPETDLIGTTARTIDAGGMPGRFLWRPHRHIAVKYLALWETPFHHPTVMARAHVLREHPYDERYSRSEDYELWSRLIFDHGIRVANMPEPLTLFRQHAQSFTKTVGTHGLEFAVGIPLRNISHYLPLDDRNRALVAAYREGRPMGARALVAWARLIARVGAAFRKREQPPPSAAPAMMRIGIGVLWRTMKRSWKK